MTLIAYHVRKRPSHIGGLGEVKLPLPVKSRVLQEMLPELGEHDACYRLDEKGFPKSVMEIRFYDDYIKLECNMGPMSWEILQRFLNAPEWVLIDLDEGELWTGPTRQRTC